MEIKHPTATPPPPAGDKVALQGASGTVAVNRTAATVTWQTGQILDARVVKSGSDGLLLNIQGQLAQVSNQLPKRSDSPLLPDQKLAVQVMAMKPEIQLKIRDPLPASPQQAVLSKALRDLLPRQQPLPPLMANIEAIARKTHTIPPMPKEIKTLGWEIYRHLSEPRQISTPAGLKQALTNLGPFLENSLLQQTSTSAGNIEQNIRTRLLRLATALRPFSANYPAPSSNTSTNPTSNPVANPAPSTAANLAAGLAADRPHPDQPGTHQAIAKPTGTFSDTGVKPNSPQPQGISNASLQTLAAQENGLEELLRQVEGALARMNVQQLHTAQASEQGRLMWLLELPVRSDQGIDLFDMRIHADEEHEAAQAGGKPWTVTIAFDLHGLGPVRATVSLQNETISARFWAELPDTSKLFSQHMDSLRSQLGNAGLEVGKLDCRSGLPDETPPPAGMSPTSSILDEKA